MSNIVQNLDISFYLNDEPLISNTNGATLKAIVKYRNHPSIIVIQNKYQDKNSFNLIELDQKQTEKEILKRSGNKALQMTDILIKVVKDNTNIFSGFLCNIFNGIKARVFFG